jgi:hypothetical protein
MHKHTKFFSPPDLGADTRILLSFSVLGTERPRLSQTHAPQKMMIPQIAQNKMERPTLPVPDRTLAGWIKIPVPIVLLRIRQNIVKRPISCLVEGAMLKS